MIQGTVYGGQSAYRFLSATGSGQLFLQRAIQRFLFGEELFQLKDIVRRGVVSPHFTKLILRQPVVDSTIEAECTAMASAMKQIKELQRLLGKKTMESELPIWSPKKADSARALIAGGW